MVYEASGFTDTPALITFDYVLDQNEFTVEKAT